MIKLVSVVIPVFNEEGSLEKLYRELLDALKKLPYSYEILLVDDGSVDNSVSLIEGFCAIDKNIKAILLKKNFGQTSALMAGINSAKGDIIVTMDADLQNPPEEITNLVRVMEEGNYDVVGTIRKGRKDSFFRILPSKIINMVARKITGVSMRDWGCMLRCYRRPVVQRMIQCHEHSTFIPALSTVFAKRVTEIEVAHEERHGGKSNYPLRKLINLQFDLVASFSDLPMRLIMYGGVLMSLLGVCFGTFLAIARLAYGARWAAEGIFTLFAVLFVFVGLQFFALGVIGEYIGRIYREVRKRPEYVIEKIHTR